MVSLFSVDVQLSPISHRWERWEPVWKL